MKISNLDYKSLKSKIDKLINNNEYKFIIDSTNKSIVSDTLKAERHNITELKNKDLKIVFFIDSSIFNNVINICKPIEWFVNKVVDDYTLITVNVTITKVHEIDIISNNKEVLDYIIKSKSLFGIKVASYNSDSSYTIFYKESFNILSNTKVKYIESFYEMTNFTKNLDDELSKVFNSLSKCDIEFSKSIVEDIIVNTDTTEFIWIAYDIINSKISEIESRINSTRKRLVRGNISRDQELSQRYLSELLLIYKQEIYSLEEIAERY